VEYYAHCGKAFTILADGCSGVECLLGTSVIEMSSQPRASSPHLLGTDSLAHIRYVICHFRTLQFSNSK